MIGTASRLRPCIVVELRASNGCRQGTRSIMGVRYGEGDWRTHDGGRFETEAAMRGHLADVLRCRADDVERLTLGGASA